MIVRPITAPARQPFVTYDFEWRRGAKRSMTARRADAAPTIEQDLELTLAGVYDGFRYRHYINLASFVRGELVERNAGKRFYAHFGGASDMVFLLRELMRDKSLSIRGLFSGSAAIVVSVYKGPLHWTFVDSFWLMRTKLEKIGAWLGKPKLTDIDPESCSFGELKDRNERDCEILYDALTLFEQSILDRGGELRVTAASTALDIFLRRYLERPIANSSACDAWARPAYTASRVERFEESCDTAEVWDINSSFPYSMTFPIPGTFAGFKATLPDDDSLWIADCDIVVPDAEHFPAVPYRSDDGRAYFPTGRMRARITNEERLAGGFTIEKVYGCWTYESRLDMARFAEDFYSLRARGGFEAEVYKIVLNSLYGKMAERDEKSVLLINPRERPDPLRSEALEPRVYLVDETVKVEHSHVAISAMITARSRRFLLEYIKDAARRGRVYYCDTDSVTCDAHFPDEPGILGRLKHEASIVRGRFHGSKLYAYETTEGKDVVKAKGFSRRVGEGGEREPLTYADFCALTDGDSIRIERMLRIKELLRAEKGEYTPKVRTADKRLLKPRPKRAPLPGGTSRPWSVNELMGAP